MFNKSNKPYLVFLFIIILFIVIKKNIKIEKYLYGKKVFKIYEISIVSRNFKKFLKKLLFSENLRDI